MEKKIHIDIHVHFDSPNDLQPAIDRILKLTTDQKAKTVKLKKAIASITQTKPTKEG